MKNIRFPRLGFNFTTLLLLGAVIGLVAFPEYLSAAPLFLAVPIGAGMILDAQLLLSDAQALTGTAVSTNILDLGSDRNIGMGEPLAIVVVVDVALDRTTADETYAVTLQADDNSGFSSALTIVGPISMLAYAAGSRYVIAIPPDLSTERFFRLNYTLGGTTPLGTVTAFLTPLKYVGVGENVYYADAITIG